MRELVAAEMDDPKLGLRRLGPNRWGMSQNVVVGDQGIDSPYLFCQSREPLTTEEWETLRAALPPRYDTWTVTEDIGAVQLAIECGIGRHLGIEAATPHTVACTKGFVEYSYDSAPPSGDPTAVFEIRRWFRKRTKYRNQAEHRLAWIVRGELREEMPETMDVKLTETSLGLFQPWTPPER